MGLESRLMAHVQGMIDELEKHIEARSLTSSFIRSLQSQIDSIEQKYREQPSYERVYGYMLEAQTLIYGESGQEQKALEFLKEAVRQRGNVSGLHSKLLRDYVAEHTPKPTAATAEVTAKDNGQAETARREARHASKLHSNLHHHTESLEETTGPVKTKISHASKLHMRLKPSHKLRIVTATAFGLLLLVGVALKVPQVSALTSIVSKHGQIATAKQKYDRLTTEYKTCSAKLITERSSVDTNNMQQLATYNQDVTDCQSILQQQHQAADAYNALVGVQ